MIALYLVIFFSKCDTVFHVEKTEHIKTINCFNNCIHSFIIISYGAICFYW